MPKFDDMFVKQITECICTNQFLLLGLSLFYYYLSVLLVRFYNRYNIQKAPMSDYTYGDSGFNQWLI